MKAVIVETKGRFAAALQSQGDVVSVKNRSYMVGDVIDLRSQRKSTKFMPLIAVASMLFMVLGLGVVYASPSYYIGLDVNPSIEYAVNRFDRVTAVTAMNADGQSILDSLNLKNKTIEQAIAETMDQLTEEGYLGQDGAAMVMVASGKDINISEQAIERLTKMVEARNRDNGQEIELVTDAIGLERVEEAKRLGVTPGKLRLVELAYGDLDGLTDDYLGTLLDQPVKDIMGVFVENKREEAKDKADEAPGAGLDKADEMKPETPGKPEAPVNPVTPEKPETPVNPVTPEKPETPVNPVTPVKPETPKGPQ